MHQTVHPVFGNVQESAPSICYLHPLMLGRPDRWIKVFEQVAGMGFDFALLAPPFDTGQGRSVFVIADHGRLHGDLEWEGSAEDGIRRLADICRSLKLGLLIDLVPHVVAAEHPLVSERPDWFLSLDEKSAGLPDPRRPPTVRREFRFEPAALDDIATRWNRQLAGWQDAGVAGFRCLGIDGVPAEFWRRLQVRPGSLLIAWTTGAARDRVAALRGGPFTHTVSSLPWWDFRSTWFFEEDEFLRRVAPPISLAHSPFDGVSGAGVASVEQLRAARLRMVGFAAGLGSGWMMPIGFERGATRAWREDVPPVVLPNSPIDLHAMVADANSQRPTDVTRPRALSLGETVLVRTGVQRILAMGASLVSPAVVTPEALLAHGISAQGGSILSPGAVLAIDGPPVKVHAKAAKRLDAKAAIAKPRIAIEAVQPCVDAGRFAVKKTIGELIEVSADIFSDGHDALAASLLWRPAGEKEWREERLQPVGNDRWEGSFLPNAVGRHVFTIAAWRAGFRTYRDALAKKNVAGQDVAVDVAEGRELLERIAASRSGGRHSEALQLSMGLNEASTEEAIALLLANETALLLDDIEPRSFEVRHPVEIPVDVDRRIASFAAWYELFPRSQSDDPARHGTFDDVIARLPMVRDMGFDVLYFPPIHPIGRTNRKGRNNALKAEPGEPGSPYAIGAAEGGHDAIHPELGTLDDFRRLVEAATRNDLEIALDFAIQCSPDHPWLKEHPDWFEWRADGSIRHAENPPKKYEDIVNVDFYGKDAAPSLWIALRDVVRFWTEVGVRIFRVDNPHTKPLPFWEWLIADIRSRDPGAIFLSEAFTRPKMMYRLAKIGFTQSYTYFTWRQTRPEFEDYLNELNGPPVRDFFRPNFFVNTPDINPPYLQNAPRAAYLIRAALAATLSGLWGLYSGFELCEGTPLPGREEYLDSEKYQLRAWDWDRPGNIRREIAALNRIRRMTPALQTHLGVRFLPGGNEAVMVFTKQTKRRDSVVLVAVSFDAVGPQSTTVALPLADWGLADGAAFSVEDLWTGGRDSWFAASRDISLNPAVLPFAIWRIGAPEAPS